MNKEVLARIERTKEEKLTYLDLRGLGLEEIPQEIMEIPWIQALSLSNNKIKDIDILSNMKELHKLALTNNRIENIDVIERLPKLRFIFLGNNKISDISKINAQPRLKKLVLNDNKIASLPDMSFFTLLAYLDLSNNPLEAPAYEEIRTTLPLLKIYLV